MIKKSLLAASVFLVSLSAHSGFDVREIGLEQGYTDNVVILPIDRSVEGAKLRFSYDIDEIEFNHQYQAAKHFIDRLPLQDSAKIKLFWHDAVVEKELTPKTLTEGSVTLNNILLKSPHNTSLIKSEVELDAYIRKAYMDKLNLMVPAKVVEKKGNRIHYQVGNFTDYRIKKIYMNFRAVDSVTGRVLMDEMLTDSLVSLAQGKTSKYVLNLPSRLDQWRDMSDGIVYKITITKVDFWGGKTFDADQLYHDVKASQSTVIDQFPFTELPKY